MYLFQKKPQSWVHKLVVFLGTVSNWYLLIQDKWLGSKGNLVYKFRNHIELECRTQSSDINEAVVVLSGVEYPHKLCRLSANGNKKVVFDVGANIGSFSLYIQSLNQHDNFEIFAFEPYRENYELCQNNFDRNELTQVKIIEKAVAGVDGVSMFDIAGSFDACKLSDHSEQAIEVKTIKLSTFCMDNQIYLIDILKVDIEGGEYAVVSQDIEFIGKYAKVILMEYHLSIEYPVSDILVKPLSEYFDISVQNKHAYGGMIIAVNKKSASM